MSDPTARPPLPGTVVEVPAHQWWGTSDPPGPPGAAGPPGVPGAPLRLRVLAIDDAGVGDPHDGWVWVTGHVCVTGGVPATGSRPGPPGDDPPGDSLSGDGSSVRVLVQLPALSGPLVSPTPPP